MKTQDKNDTNVSFDDESAFLSLNSNVQLSSFTPDSNEVYLQSDMSLIYDNSHVVGYHSHVAFPSTAFEILERTSNDKNDYYFLRLPSRHIDIMVDDWSEPSYETIHFSDISNTYEHISGSTNH